MRWLRYEHEGRASYGILEGERITPVTGTPFDGYEKAAGHLALDAVRVLIPVEPRTFYAAGLNYIKHISEAAELLGTAVEVPAEADIGYRATNALIADGEPIVIPKDAGERVQYEGELVVVVGRRAKHLSEAEALDCVLGYTIGNDVSERGWQASDRTLWRAKNTDTFKPMGPWIDTEVDLDALLTSVRVDGEVKCAFATNDMIFSIRTFIARMSRYLTLYPGDVIWMGADGPTENIKPGNTVEVEIDGIGILTNPVVAET